MTEKIIVKDLAKQDPGSALVYLYELEYAEGQFAYFHDGLDANLGEVTMLDYSNNSQTNTYKALPVKFDGLERTAATKFPAPIVTFANLLTTLNTPDGSSSLSASHVHRIDAPTSTADYTHNFEYTLNQISIPTTNVRTTVNITTQPVTTFDSTIQPYILVEYIIKF